MQKEQKRKLKYSIVFCDIDDTLLDDRLQISKLTASAIHQYISCNGKFVLVTGRNYLSTKKIYNSLNLDTLLIVNQGIVYNPKTDQILYEKSFNTYDLIKLCKLLEQKNVYFQLFCDNIIYVKKKTFYSQQYIQRCEVKIVETGELLSSFIVRKKISFSKLMIECDEAFIDPLFFEIVEQFEGVFSITKSKSWIIEISPLGLTKGNAIEYILKEYGIRKDRAMAIGDSDNDISMFNKVGFSIAVKNSSPDILISTNAITESNNNSGVGYALEEYVYL